MKSSLTVLFLLLSGLLLLTIGSAILLTPQVFYANEGISLGSDPSLLSEIRASGGLLASSAFVILLGTVRPTLRSSAIILSTLIYGSFGFARLLGLALDGAPSDNLLMAIVIELMFASLGPMLLRPWPNGLDV